MIDKEIHWNLSLNEVLQINNKEFISIQINRGNLTDIFYNNKLSKSVISLIDANTAYINDKLYDNVEEDYGFNLDISMYAYKGDKNYKIGYDIKNTIKNILNRLNIRLNVDDYNLKNDLELFNLIEKIKENAMNEYYFLLLQDDVGTSKEVKDKSSLLLNLDLYIEKIIKQMIRTNEKLDELLSLQANEEQDLRDNKKKLTKSNNSLIKPKNLLMYSAAKSICAFYYNSDISYYRYAKDYYKNVSKDGNAEYPNGMTIDNYYYDHEYYAFNKIFDYVRNIKFNRLFIDLGIEDKDSITTGNRTLKSTQKNQHIPINNNSPKRKIDYDKVNKALGRKIAFYKGLEGKSQGIIDSLNKDTDYIGFVLDNNYVIFDKFYEISKDGSMIKPAIDNAVYIVTLDVLESCDHDTKKLRDYIRRNKDYKAFRFYHNDKDSYQKRIEEISNYSDISTISYKDLKLKRNTF